MGKFTITEIRRQRAAKDGRKGYLRRFLTWGGGVLLLVILFLIFGAPPIVRSQLEKRLSAELDRSVAVGSVSINPFKGAITVEELHIQAKDAGELLGWKRLYVNLNVVALVSGNLHFDTVELEGVGGRVIVDADGKLSVDDIIRRHAGGEDTKGAGKQSEGKGMALLIDNLRVSGAKLAFEDNSGAQRFATEVGPLSFTLRDFAVLPDRKAPYDFTASTESGEQIEWRGTLGVAPFRSAGELKLSGINLAKYSPYYGRLVKFKVRDGVLDLQSSYELELAAQGPRVVVTGGQATLRNLAIAHPQGGEPVLSLAELSLDGIHADTVAQKAEISALRIRDPRVIAVRGKDRVVDLQSLLAPKGADAETAKPQTSAVPTAGSNAWSDNLVLHSLSVINGSARLTDQAALRPVVLDINEVTFEAKEVRLSPGAKIATKFGAKIAGTGQVGAVGTVVLAPLFAEVEWSLKDLPLPLANAYLEELFSAQLAQGRFAGNGNVSLSSATGAAPVLSGKAELLVSQLSLVSLTGEALFAFDSLALTGCAFDTSGRQLSVGEIALHGPVLNIRRNREGILNLQRAFTPREQASGIQEQPALQVGTTADAPYALRLGKISIDGGAANFRDQSSAPEVRFSFNGFGGHITGLDSKMESAAAVSLAGNLEGTGRISLEGALQPFGERRSVDLRFGIDSLNLVAFSPYSSRYAGYALSGGRLSFDVKATLRGKALDSANVMTIDHFSFGDASNSPEATKLPVRLAVALLKDRSGRIVVDLPVQGNFDDPEFKVGRVVWRVIGNILTKAATSPFALLGAAFGGGDELSHLEFEVGASQLTPSTQERIATLKKALVERPGLGVTLIGGYDQGSDAAALRSRRLDERVRRTVLQARRAGEAGTPADLSAPPTEDERRIAIQAMYLARSGRSIIPVIAPAPAAGSAPATSTAKAAEAGFFSRVWAAITGRRVSKAKAPEAKGKISGSAVAGSATHSVADSAPAIAIPQAEQIRALEADIELNEGDLVRLGLDRAQAVERALIEGGVESARINVAVPAATSQKVEVQLR